MSLKIHFLCGHNSGRSIAAEAICKKIRPELKASSAGTKAGKRITPEVKKSLQKKDFSVVGFFPKSIDCVCMIIMECYVHRLILYSGCGIHFFIILDFFFHV